MKLNMLKSRTWTKSVFWERYEVIVEGIGPRSVNYDAFFTSAFSDETHRTTN